MIQEMYSKGKKEEIRLWRVETKNDGLYEITFGIVDGKLQTKQKIAKPKNVGKRNETTSEEQATLEAKALVSKQYDKGYRFSIEDALNYEAKLPMLAHDYTKNKHNINYPCYISPKLDGVRALSSIVDGRVVLTSRGGKEYPCPEHIKNALLEIFKENEIDSLDGELYCHGMKLQDIVSAVKSENEDVNKIKFFVFDIPVKDTPWERRLHVLRELSLDDNEIIKQGISVVPNFFANEESDAMDFLNDSIENGFEGIMLRNINGLYLFDFRSRDLQKWKLMHDLEALVIDVLEDNNGEGVLVCKLPLNDLIFKCKMKGTHEERLFKESCKLTGKWITVKYQAFTNLGLPQFPVGLYVRDCDSKGNPLI